MAATLKLGMVMLGVTDMARSVAFYRDTVGLALQGEFPGFAFLDAGGVTLILSEELAKRAARTNGATELVLTVDHVKDAAAELKSRGVVFIQEPRVVTGDRWAANFTDPDGHLWSVFGAE